jgi:hypothetical protein
MAFNGYTAGDTWLLAAATVHESGEFRRHFDAEGMAEWSMAVVLKNGSTESTNPRNSH